jgi:MFS family permease
MSSEPTTVESVGPDTLPRGSWRALTVLLIAQAMGNMDSSIVNVATRTIRDGLSASAGELQAILVGYTLAFGTLVVTGARLGDDRGHRTVFLTGLSGFMVASLLCGLAPDAASLALARAVQGGMGALMIPQVLSTIQLTFSGPRLTRALSYYSMILALGVAAGQIVGGLIVGANLFGQSWRIAFLINVPIGIVVLLLGHAHLPASTRRQAVRLDLIGVGLLGLSLALLLLPLMFGRDQGWPLWTWLSLAAGAIGLVGFVGHERALVARDARPLLDLRALRPRGTKPGLLALCLLNYSFAGLLFPLTLHLQTALGYTPLQAGLMLVPYPIGFATISLTWTRSPVRWHARLPVVGLVVFSVAAALLAFTVHTGWPVPRAAAILCVAGAGMATAMSPLINQVAATVGPAYASAVSALISTGTLLSSVLAITTAGGLYLTFAEHDTARSATGITWSSTLVSALLLLATACAVRIWYVSARMPGRTGN